MLFEGHLSRIVLIAVLFSTAVIVAVAESPSKEINLWKGALNENTDVKSYLFENRISNAPEAEVVHDLMKIIHSKQYLDKQSCKTSRLMVISMKSSSFEGTGSLLKQVLIALASAIHSNRTLIWGIGLPFTFEHTREIWQGSAGRQVTVGDNTLDCITASDVNAGPYGCFFQKLSTCTIGDISHSELIEFSNNGYDDNSRIRFAEVSRTGVALYRPPTGLFDYLWSQRKNAYKSRKLFERKQGHMWSAAVAAYVFRVKPDVVQQYLKRNDRAFQSNDTIWGLHVRHGDLAALPEVYGHKNVYQFEEYFAAARELARSQKTIPKHLFIATDSVKADSAPAMFQKFLRSESQLGKKKNNNEKARGKSESAAASKSKSSKTQLPRTDVEDDDDDDYEDKEDEYYYDDNEEYDDDYEDDDEYDDDYDSDSYDDDDDDYDDENDDDEYDSVIGDDDDDVADTADGVQDDFSYDAAAAIDYWYGMDLPSVITINNTRRSASEPQSSPAYLTLTPSLPPSLHVSYLYIILSAHNTNIITVL